MYKDTGIESKNGTTFATHLRFLVLFKEVFKMKKSADFLALVIIFAVMNLPCTVSADKSFKIHTPRGGLTTLLITTCALKKVRIHNFEFSDSGDTFSVEGPCFNVHESQPPIELSGTSI